MTQSEVQIVKKSWWIFLHMDPAIVGAAFYSRLFNQHPELRHMFPKDMQQQYSKLVGMLNIVVMRLERLEELTTELHAMAERHTSYGVKPEHYAAIKDALLWTLGKAHGSEFSDELKNAWSKAYDTLTISMTTNAH